MTPVLILTLIFFAGFGVGYATRAWQSHKRKLERQLYAPYGRSSRPAARRAF
jgi:uncharacterized membrane protein YidH (DUF202 family)